MKISGSTFIVTGGLGGLGSECVRMLLEQGASVGVIDIVEQGQGAERLAKALQSDDERRRTVYAQASISDRTSAERAVADIVAKHGNLRGLVHCAGVALRQEFSNKMADAVDQFRKTLEVNAVGTFCIGAVVADAINAQTEKELGLSAQAPSRFWSTDQERGVIVNFASVVGHEPSARILGYGPSKTCVLGLTKSFADFLAPSGIRVNSVSPGIVATPMNTGKALEFFNKDLLANGVFPKRASDPAHVTSAVRFLIENEFVNAEDIKVTGGWRIVTTSFPGQGDPRDSMPGLE